jgi:hypothetical protein
MLRSRIRSQIKLTTLEDMDMTLILINHKIDLQEKEEYITMSKPQEEITKEIIMLTENIEEE